MKHLILIEPNYLSSFCQQAVQTHLCAEDRFLQAGQKWSLHKDWAHIHFFPYLNILR